MFPAMFGIYNNNRAASDPSYKTRKCSACDVYAIVYSLTAQTNVDDREAQIAYYESFVPFEAGYDSEKGEYIKLLCPKCASYVPEYSWEE